ncbi:MULTISPECIES: hypothetical protein [unclassified Nocardia]|uniref:hypothetical protein n=1 Tax=unclassified Nocardia TaxID=2637762 RepID=UPI001CE44E3F|nr:MULTISPECIES: hypothetical protein [unclassified Nocardia]
MSKSRATLAGSFAVLVACTVVTGCGATDQHADGPAKSVVTRSDSPVVRPSGSAAVTIGEVPGDADAVKAIQPWARDLAGGDIDRLIRNCWTIEPDLARKMYADRDGILDALARRGVDGQFAVIWRGPAETVHVQRNEIASGYACPRVIRAGSDAIYGEADARYVVRRYLSRLIGAPVNPDDVEAKYRLVCPDSPLLGKPGILPGITAFAADGITSRPGPNAEVAVTVPVTDAAGTAQTITFALTVSQDGYCIKDLAA